MRERSIAGRGEGISHRLELAQRAAVAVVFAAFAGLEILHFFGIRLGLFASRWVATGVALAVALIVLLSAWSRGRQVPIFKALLLVGAAAVSGNYSDNVLLVSALAVGVTSAAYLAAQFVGFLLPVRWQPRIDAAATDVALVSASISSMLVLAELLLWIL